MWIAEFSESSNLWTHLALLGIPRSMPVWVSWKFSTFLAFNWAGQDWIVGVAGFFLNDQLFLNALAKILGLIIFGMINYLHHWEIAFSTFKRFSGSTWRFIFSQCSNQPFWSTSFGTDVNSSDGVEYFRLTKRGISFLKCSREQANVRALLHWCVHCHIPVPTLATMWLWWVWSNHDLNISFY